MINRAQTQEQQNLYKQASLLGIFNLTSITEKEIEEALQKKLAAQNMEPEQAQLLQEAAGKLKTFIANKNNSSTEISKEASYEITLQNSGDANKVLQAYHAYTTQLKAKNPTNTEFDNLYQPKEEVRENKKIITLVFQNQADADAFIENLKRQNILFSVQKIARNPAHSAAEAETAETAPSQLRNRR